MKISSVNSSLLNGTETMQKVREAGEGASFSDLVKRIRSSENFKGGGSVSSANVIQDGRLNGDFASGFANTFTSESDKKALPVGAAANGAGVHAKSATIDRTSKLYEKSLELESYIVKIMVSSMRSTVTKTSLFGGDSFANVRRYDVRRIRDAAYEKRRFRFGGSSVLTAQRTGVIFSIFSLPVI